MPNAKNYSPSKLAYEIYATEREKIIRRMESGDYSTLDVGEKMTKDDFDLHFNILQGEYNAAGKTDFNARSLAKDLAKKQTYYVSPAAAEKTIEAFEKKMGQKIEKYELLYGSERTREFYNLLDEEYHEKKEEARKLGMSEKDATIYAKRYISYTYYGSEEL